MADRIGKPISQRQLRVGEMIKQSLSMIFIRNEAKVPNLETNTITVTEVRMSQDLKIAKAYVLPLGGKNAEEIIEADKKRLIVNAFVRYKIIDPLKFYQTVRFEAALNNRLGSVVNNSLRAVLGRAPLQAVISDRREQLMAEVSGLVAERATQFGISIEEVRIKKADLPSENSEAIYRRMQTERQQEAAQIRAVGEEKSRFIRAEAEKNKTILLAEAQRDGDILRGQGDAEKNKILGKAFSQDPEFFSFYRSMQAYSRALSEGDTTMVLSPKSDFFEFFGRTNGKK